MLFKRTTTQEESKMWASIISDVTCLCLSDVKEKVKAVFDNLIQLEHLNIVKFHKYWADVKENKARVSKMNSMLGFLTVCPVGN